MPRCFGCTNRQHEKALVKDGALSSVMRCFTSPDRVGTATAFQPLAPTLWARCQPGHPSPARTARAATGSPVVQRLSAPWTPPPQPRALGRQRGPSPPRRTRAAFEPARGSQAQRPRVSTRLGHPGHLKNALMKPPRRAKSRAQGGNLGSPRGVCCGLRPPGTPGLPARVSRACPAPEAPGR